MYKKILFIILIFFISACSTPKVEKETLQKLTTPVDANLYYAVGVSDTVEKAKKNAVTAMREGLNKEVDSLLKNTRNQLQPLESEMLENILSQNAHISKKLSLQKIKIEKSQKFKNNRVILISISKEKLFKKLKTISNKQFLRVKQEYDINQSTIAIKRFSTIQRLMRSFTTISSFALYKSFLQPTYSADEEFGFLKKINREYNELKTDINIYVLTDANSRIFVPNIKDAINKKGLSTKNSVDNNKSLKLLITSTTEQTKDYNFFQSKSTIKLTTFNKKKKIIAFKQYIFIGQSAKNYKDAKGHAYTAMSRQLKKNGLFKFIGINK